jgi:hypothetical protein
MLFDGMASINIKLSKFTKHSVSVKHNKCYYFINIIRAIIIIIIIIIIRIIKFVVFD